MKLADAYMQKANYRQASKQFVKVLKKAPAHIPAILGYATALERLGQPKKICETALIYGNATKTALAQGDDRLATIALRRAVVLASTSDNKEQKLDTLRKLSELSFTAEIASDIYFAVGSEIMEGEGVGSEEDAMNSFAIANKFYCSQDIDANDTAAGSASSADSQGECHGHGKSLIAMARLALTSHEDAKEALRYANLSLESEIDDDAKISAHVLVGRSKIMIGETKAAIDDFRQALDFHIGEATGEAHYHLAIALQATGGDVHAIENHFEQALNMGMPLTSEAINALGENNLAVRRSANRQQWAEYERAQAASMQQRGGIMSGGGSSFDGNSVFASQQQDEYGAGEGAGPSQLDMLAEGASQYDGSSVPDGEESGVEGLNPDLSGQGAASSRARTTSS